MIANSDAVLVLVSVTLLGAGLLRWQGNVDYAVQASQQRAANAQISQQATLPRVPAEQNTLASQRESITTGIVNAEVNAEANNVPTTETRPVAPVVANDNTTIANSEVGPSSTGLFGSYVVQSGDSLSRIAVLYGTSVEQLQQINDMDGTLIFVGQELRYPLPAN